MRTRHIVMAAALLVVGAAAFVTAQDPAVVNAKTVKVRLDNDKVRVLEATLKPGEKEELHAHPAYVIYVISGGTMRNHAVNGTTSDATWTDGQTIYRDPLTHWAENVGKTTVHLILVELKK